MKKELKNLQIQLKKRQEEIKLILIAGPSASGKTTFTKKLAIQLEVYGFNPSIISTDNYFLPRLFDFESIRAIDVELFKGIYRKQLF